MLLMANHISWVRICLSIFLPVIISYRGYLRQSLSRDGALISLIIGFVLTISNYCFMSSVIAFFIVSSKLTKYKAQQKLAQDSEYRQGGQRNWKQVLSVGGISTVIAFLYLLAAGSKESLILLQNKEFKGSVLSLAFIGSVACACGDTFASEIGSVSSGRSCKLITNLSNVPVGTNGGVSLIGTIASAAGGLLVGFTYFLTLCIIFGQFLSGQLTILLTSTLAGIFGSIIDSILGATLQYSGLDETTKKITNSPSSNSKRICGRDILSNHSVNFISGILTALFTPFIHYGLCQY